MGNTAAPIQDSYVQPGGNNSRTAAMLQEEAIMCSDDDSHLRSFLSLLPSFPRAHPLAMAALIEMQCSVESIRRCSHDS